MTQVEKIFKIEQANPLELYGINNSNLKPLEEKFNASIVARGDTIFIKGTLEETILIEKVLKEMIFTLNTSGQLTQRDVEIILDLTLDNMNYTNGKKYDSVVLYTKYEPIKVKTPTQQKYFEAIKNNDIVFAIGPAGTGKTYLAVAFAALALKNGSIKKIALTRPAVEAGESLGFLPGDLKEKIDPYLRPLYDALEDMMPYEKLKNYLEKGTIEIAPLAYMRGRTLNNAFVILDEAQNATTLQMKMFLTRLGPNSKSIITGDITQIDLPKKSMSGLLQAIDILQGIEGVAFVYFDKNDVVRHRLVKDIIDAYEKYSQNSEEKINY